MSEDTLAKVRKGRQYLVLRQPFFGLIALNLTIQANEQIPTTGTDGRHLFYNPEHFDGLRPDQVRAEIAHEVMHIVCHHLTRREKRDPDLWNRAGDYVINPILKDSKFTISSDWLLEDKYRGWTTGQVYRDLERQQQQQKKQQGCGCGGLVEPKDENGKPLQGADLAAHEAKVKQIITQAATHAKMAGNLPGGLQEMIEGLTKPHVDWQGELRLCMEEITHTKHNFLRPNRRHRDFVMPSRHNIKMGTMVVAIDSSGSVSPDELRAFGSELSGILAEVTPEKVIVLWCDTEVRKVEEYEPEDLPLKLTAHGRGGTDFRGPFKWAEDNDIDPACLVYFTDLMCRSYPEEPEYQVFWTTYGDTQQPIPFGTHINIKEL